MNTQITARIMLTAIGLGAIAYATYFIAVGEVVIFGALVILTILAFLVWIWQPWTWFRGNPHR